jgi:type VI secretion system protein ImpC
VSDPTPKHDLEVDLGIPDGLKVTTEKPYRILFVGDFAGSDKGSVRGALGEGVVEVNANSFDALMKDACPTVRYTTADPTGPGNVMTEVELSFDSLKSFDPRSIAERLEPTRGLMAVRNQLVARMRGQAGSDAVAQAVRSAAASSPALQWLTDSMRQAAPAAQADHGAVDSLLGQIDLGDGSTADSPPAKSPIGAAVAAAARDASSVPAEEASAIRRTLAEIDRRLGAWLNAILHSPQIQPVESAWRSLAFLVSQLDFRKGLRLGVLHAPRAELTTRFVSSVIDPVFDEGVAAPDLILVDTAFGNTAPDMEVLDEMAQHGASLPAVVLAGAAPGFFGVQFAWQVPTLPPVISLFDQWQFAKWKALRSQAYARSLGVIFGRCLLRPPHARDGDSLEFGFKEDNVAEKDFLWANGPLPVACAIGRSVAELGWPTMMAGFVNGRIEGFASATGGKDGKKPFGPADTQLVQTKVEELAGVGLNAVAGIPDHHDVLVWNGLCAARPQKVSIDGLLEVSLPYQLFAGRLSGLLFDLKPHLERKSAEQIVPFVLTHVKDWLKTEGEPEPEQVSVQARPLDDDPQSLQLVVTVTPPARVLPNGLPVVLGYRIK